MNPVSRLYYWWLGKEPPEPKPDVVIDFDHDVPIDALAKFLDEEEGATWVDIGERRRTPIPKDRDVMRRMERQRQLDEIRKLMQDRRYRRK